MKYVYLGLGALAVHLTHTAVLPHLGMGAFLFLPLLLCVCYGYWCGPWVGAVTGLILALAGESVATFPTMSLILPYVVAGGAAGLVANPTAWQSKVITTVVTMFAVFFIHLRMGMTVVMSDAGQAVWNSTAMGGARFSIWQVVGVVGLDMLYHGALIAALLFGGAWLAGLLAGRQKNRRSALR